MGTLFGQVDVGQVHFGENDYRSRYEALLEEAGDGLVVAHVGSTTTRRRSRPSRTYDAQADSSAVDQPDSAPSGPAGEEPVAQARRTPTSLLDTLGSTPATIWFEGTLSGLPCHADPTRHEIREVPRRDAGAHLVERVRAELPELLASTPHPYVWIACDTTTIRALASSVRKELAVPKQRVHALGYWRAT
ncbi:SIP domain-containing protein [Streptomyces sp. NPDC001984]